MHLLPVSTESISERRIVGAGTLLLHVLLAWYVLHAVNQGVAGIGDALRGSGDALVVEFVAISAEGSTRAKVPALPALNPALAENSENAEQAIPNAGSDRPRIVSEQGEYTPPPDKASTASASAQSQAATSASAAESGAAASDLVASYRAALRARIVQTWRTLTDRAFPSGCSLRLSQNSGGVVTATSANGCALSQEDRLRLEAATLMAQPLPYAGYEAVFAENLVLPL